ncbi:MAG: PAS domain S-box protein [Actinobacteria bacterium]|nr:PAS domain S-box protein [Actinomycetota bacterium]
MRIQREVEEKKILERIVAISEEFLQFAGSELNYQKITDNILDISGAKYAVFNLFDEDGSKFRTVAFSAPDGIIKKASSLLGFKLLGKKWDHAPVIREKAKSTTITHFSTLSEIAGDLIAKPLVSLLEKTFNTGEVVYVKILKENVMIGDFTLIMPSNVKFKNYNYVEIYTRQVGLLITNEKAKEALKESEEKFRLLIENSHDIIYTLSPEGVFTFVSPGWTVLLGHPVSQVVGKPFQPFVHPDDFARCQAFLQRTVETGERQTGIEYRVQHADGSWRWHTSNAVPLKDEADTVVGYEGIARDITERKKAEEALRESEEIFRSFMEYSPIYVFFKDENIRALQLSKNYETMLGKPVEELLGKDMYDLFPPELAKTMVEDDMRILKAGQVVNAEEELNGRFYSTTKFPIFIEGKPRYLAGYTIDITERKKAEEALQESEEKYRSLIERANDGIAVLVDGIIRFSNPSLAAMLGYEIGEVEGLEFARLILPENLELVMERYRKRMAGEKLSPVFETVLLHKSGNEISIETNGAVIQYEGKSADLVILRDITERKRTEEQNRFQSHLLDNVSEAIIATDINYNIQFWNKIAEKQYGWTAAEVIGYPLEKFIINDYLGGSLESILQKISQDGYWQGEVTQNRSDGGRIPIISTVSVIKDNKNQPVGFIAINRDITDRKLAEEEILHLSYHDQLTRLYNRRFAEEEIKRLDTKRQLPLSFAMIDLNSLKLINDTFGHSEGDKMLKETAGLLKRICRADDILARWGGDEFVILLPKTSVTDSEEIMQRIKKECKKLIIQKIPLSLAIGIATKIEVRQYMDEVIIEAESNMYRNKLVEKESNASSIVFALEQALYEKSSETMEHVFRIKDFAIKLGESIKLHPNQLDELSLLASLHDIGKVAIPETILLKEDKLTKKEWEVIKRHPMIGFNIAQSSPQIIHIAKSILACHENWDGSGYPKGLAGESIPILSRIISIAEAYDVMTSERKYKKAMSKPEAIEELKRCAGIQFEPVLVNKFIEIISN